ncbi:hypothetical protein J5N97_006198 [Dioscorea zingiberensis]|uniref:Uncharacterized protein n=1 Tax=Dioscorea zingiberensis TaxID=325984 RepID=A0A9D5HTR6_9LILI|nr:hypothetical protein J5N97_006198 [Dioscorea zingiberensis]
MSARSQDRGSSPLKSRKSGELKSSGQNAGGGRSMPTRNYQKPWPRRKAVGDDELVKYMSSVPHYLQHPGQEGDNPHARALNFGVLDWGLLEKWAYNQKIVTAGRVPDSSSDSNASSSMSPFSSSSQSSRSVNSPLSGKKQTSSSHSVQTSQSQPLAKENFKYSVGTPDAKRSSETTPVDQIHVDKSAKDHLNDQQTQTVALSHNVRKVRDYRSRGEFVTAEISEKQKCSDTYLKKESPANILPASDRLQNQQVAIHKQIGKTQNYLQRNVHRRGTSYEYESITFDAEEPKEVSRISYSGDLSSVGVHYREPSFYGPHSCPLLPDFQCVELNGARPPTPTLNSNNKHEKHDNFSSISRELFRVFMAEESGEDLVKVSGATRGREFPLDHQSSPGLNSRGRSSSLREGSSMHQARSVTSSETHVDKASHQSKSRRSPLRRLLDPLVKPKSRNNVSGPIACSATHRPDEWNSCSRALFQDDAVDGSINSGSASMNSLKCRAESNLKTSNDVVSVNNSASTLDEKNVPSTRQALLQLAWKNGLPLFMFSSNDNDILAATMKRRNFSNKDDFECVYTIYSVHEVKKKSGIWINQGSKSKKHGLVSDVVGQIKVSRGDLTDRDSRSHLLTRQFVLFGAEVIPTVHEPIDSVFNKELAAVVVKVLDDKRCNDQDINMHTEDYLRRLSLASIVAILPSGIHGSSATGEPSPLIERWKSGGLCDCGGWDEGCMLTVLSDKILENKNSGSVVHACLTTDGTHRIELFSQGDSQEKKCALSMVAFREGLYTVDFRSSLDLLQAFVICIATLHSKNPPHQAKFPSVEPNNFQEHVLSDHLPSSVRRHRDDPTRCLPNHPPISPVERD